jgi:isopenicillin-N N-acyltransferase like protein
MASLLGRAIECSGDSRTRGRAHGEALRVAIADTLERWAEYTARATGLHPAAYIEGLLAATDFVPAIAHHTPGLLEEVRGIAEGAGVAFDTMLAHNLMDEQWWHHHEGGAGQACSLVSVPAGPDRPAMLAQNMDLPDWTDGAQAVVHHRGPDGLDTVVLTAAGMIGLTGLNSAGVGVCVNALSMLRHAADGLPVAFALRGALERPSGAGAAAFLRSVPHASGQHYAVADPEGAVGIECSAGKTVDSASGGRFWHTNHPLRSRDIDPGAPDPEGTDDSRTRQRRLEQLAAGLESADDCKRLLSDREAPLCVHPAPERRWLTFGSVVYELETPPRAWVAAGPPDTTAFAEHRLPG